MKTKISFKNILRYTVTMLFGIILIAGLTIALSLYNKRNEVTLENFYVEQMNTSDMKLDFDYNIEIIDGHVDVNDMAWLTLFLPDYNISFDVPMELVCSLGFEPDKNGGFSWDLEDTYRLEFRVRDISDEEFKELKNLVGSDKSSKEKAPWHLGNKEKFISEHVDFIVDEGSVIMISKIKDSSYLKSKEESVGIKDKAAIGYKYTLVNNNKVYDIKFVEPFKNHLGIMRSDYGYQGNYNLKHVMNTIKILI